MSRQIDPVPVGYFGLDEALSRLAADISDLEALKDAALGPAPLAWVKRELGISKLHVALRDSALVGLVRNPVSGELFRLTGTDWHALAQWRVTILGGVVQASAGEEIARHDGRRVLLEASAFDEWLKMRANPERTRVEQMSAAEPIAPAPPQSCTEEVPPAEAARAPAGMAITTSPNRQSRRARQRGQGAQTIRARTVLQRIWPDDYPTREQVSDVDVWDRFCNEYARVEDCAKPTSKHGRPSVDVVLRELGRRT